MHLNTIIINLISEKTLNSFLYCILLANQYPVTENQINEESRKLLFFFQDNSSLSYNVFWYYANVSTIKISCKNQSINMQSKPMDRF